MKITHGRIEIAAAMICGIAIGGETAVGGEIAIGGETAVGGEIAIGGEIAVGGKIAVGGETAAETNGLAARYAGEIRFAEDERERPSIANGTFHLGGRPVFFLGPWIYNHTKEDWPAGNPDPPGVGHFAYRELPGRSVLERVGFNAWQL